jgi:hypothetical protein
MKSEVPQVGAPDPEHKTSMIVDEDEELSFDLELETGVCYFNGTAYAVGGTAQRQRACCEERGVWVRKGEMRPDEAA